MTRSVLVVDDDASFRSLAVRILRASAFDVAGEAATAQEALEQATALQPDVVLADIGLPDGTGYELTAELRALPNAPTVVLVSSDAGPAQAHAARRAGACGFIPKDELAADLLHDLAEPGGAPAAPADEYRALGHIAALVARGVADEELFAAVDDAVADIVAADVAALLWFEADDMVRLAAVSAREDVTFPIGEQRPLTDPIRAVRDGGRACRFDKLPPGTPFLEEAVEYGISTAIGVPVAVEGRVWGAIFAAWRDPTPPRAGTERRIAAFTELVAAALANAQRREALHRIAEEQASLRRVAELVARGVPEQDLFAAVAAEASRLIGGEATTLLRFDDGSATVLAVCGGPAPMGASFAVSPDDETTPGRVLRTGRPVRTAAYAKRGAASYVRQYDVHSSAGAPIIVAERIWGMLGATSSEGPLPVGTEDRLLQFAELAAAALANAQARADRERVVEEQAALRRVAELIAGGAATSKVLDCIAKEASQLLDGGQLALIRYDGDGHATVVAAWCHPELAGSRVALEGGSVHAEVLRTGRPFITESIASTPLADVAERSPIVQEIGVPITVVGETWGMLSMSFATRVPARAAAVLSQFADLAGAAIANAAHRAQLTASRARVVAAGDESRRQVQRDLHDGAQQRFVQTILNLRLAHETLAREGHPATALVEEALRHAETGNRELRDLVRGILPASLLQGGLRSGIESLAEDLPLRLDLDVTDARFAAAVETTAYFVVAEALTNVVKHAGAATARVRAGVHGDTLRVQVCDDGVGGADPADGSGLTGLLDRVEAAGGTLAVISSPGAGTAVTAALPATVR